MKILLGLSILKTIKGSEVELPSDCRDDLPREACLDKVYVDTCSVLDEDELNSCLYTCRMCQTSDCHDVIGAEQCFELIKRHAISPCKKLNFHSRFQCRETCSICKPSGPVISLKSARDPEEFLSPELGANLFKPFNPNASPGSSNPLPETIFDLPKKKKNKEEEKISTKERNEEEMREILNMKSEVKIPFWLIIAVGSSWLVLLWLAAWVGWKCRQCVQKKSDFEKDEMIRTAKSFTRRNTTDPLPIPNSLSKLYRDQSNSDVSKSYLIKDFQNSESTSQSSAEKFHHEDEKNNREASRDKRNGEKQGRNEGREAKSRNDRKSERATRERGGFAVETSAESGIEISEPDQQRLTTLQEYHKSVNQQCSTSSAIPVNMLLAKDNFSSESKKERPIVPRRLTPEEIRQKELLQMVSQANNQILIRKNSSENGTNEESTDDVQLVPLGSKKISLGEANLENIAKKENQKRSRKARSTPLSKWADSAKSAADETGVCLAREIHENGEILPELPEEEKILRKERRRNRGNTRKIDKIKKKINKLERECALSNSEIDLSELSDEGVMESVRY